MKTRTFVIFALIMAISFLPANVAAKTKAKTKKKAVSTTQVTPAKKKIKVTNSVEVCIPYNNYIDEEEQETQKVTVITLVKDPPGEGDEGSSNDEDVNDMYEDFVEEIEVKDQNSQVIEVVPHITLILDTERDASGNALRRHIYLNEVQDTVYENRRHIKGPNKITRLSFPATDAGLEQWRQELLKFFALKNKPMIDKVNALKERWRKGEINERAYQINVEHAYLDVSPVVLIKPLGNAESGDVIDAYSVMSINRIAYYQFEDINHNDSVMVFNSLFPGKDMPCGVNFYTYGKITDSQQHFDYENNIPESDLEFGSELRFDPILTIEVKENPHNKDGATASIMFDEKKYKETLHLESNNKREKRKAYKALASKSYKQMVKNYGNSVAEPKWFDVEPVDPYSETSKVSKFQQPIYDLKKALKNSIHSFLDYRTIWLYADRHTPFKTLKCVIDNLRQIDINRMTLAY